MNVKCPRCNHILKYVRGNGKQMRCKICLKSLTRRHEVNLDHRN